ncbi:MAG: CidA/LrgA family protein [Alphaproteobacteria bacterium]|nr:CidA/LrgA family protein [Alphaproteobacteria bacterium]MCL2889809.1 CidA/LrgA family protein [Alphaproteobacteria bacterium]
MKYLSQFLLLMVFVVAGEFVHAIVPLPVPASIWGLILLLGALWTRVIKLSQIEDVANFFLIIIPVLFVVPAVGVLEIFGDIAYVWPAMLLVIILTYFAAMVSTGWLAEFMIWWKDRKQKARKK